jgi:beta-lactamase class A
VKSANQKIIIVFIPILLALSIAGNIFLYAIYRSNEASRLEEKGRPVFKLLSPRIAWMNTEEFLKIRNHYAIGYSDLKENIKNVLNHPSGEGHYGVYFEDLNTGSWIGINEKDEFVPASLLKIPIMVAVLKKVEDGDLALDQTVTLEEEDLDLYSGTLGLKGAGHQFTIKELLTFLIKESDNTAYKTLTRKFLTVNDWAKVNTALGLSPKVGQDGRVTLTPKQYSNILRSLYYSTYIRRVFSELCLSIMSATDYNNQLPAGIPPEILISHKYGEYASPGPPAYSDCGIIYYPDKPYILCVMSSGATKESSEKMIREISRTVYAYVDENQKRQNNR